MVLHGYSRTPYIAAVFAIAILFTNFHKWPI
nr:MAG TPA: hypothetical protein [Caudoviricetes sp.]DAL76021.1 MAG TPA: hypothetical protein [Caudoviricetes sp.]